MPVLYIRDKSGNFVSIPSIKGADGKSAYQQAVDGGYTGTEEEFIAVLNGLTASEAGEHYSDFSNPHNVTASQVGALSINGGTLAGKTLYFDNGNARISGGEDYIQMDVFDSPKDDANRRKLVLNGNDTSLSGAVVLTVRENGVDKTYTIYGGHNKPKASDVGAVSKSGDNISGILKSTKEKWGQFSIEAKDGNYRAFEADEQRARIDVRDTTETTDRRFLDIFSNAYDSRHSHAMRLTQVNNDVSTTAYCLHTENINDFVISKGQYTGGGSQSKTIPIRKTTQMVIVYATSTSGDAWMFGALIRGMKRAHCNLAAGGEYSTNLDVSWTDTNVTYGLYNADPRYCWDYSGTIYNYVVVG